MFQIDRSTRLRENHYVNLLYVFEKKKPNGGRTTMHFVAARGVLERWTRILTTCNGRMSCQV